MKLKRKKEKNENLQKCYKRLNNQHNVIKSIIDKDRLRQKKYNSNKILTI